MDGVASFTHVVPRRFEELPELRSALSDWLAESGVDEAAAADVVLAAWEVCADAIEHRVDRDDPDVRLAAQASPAGICVTVADRGEWARAPSPRPLRGLGLGLVRAVMDRVSITSGRAGTEVTMWRRTGAPA